MGEADVLLPACDGTLGGSEVVDECQVCGGNSSCHGCDQVAYSGHAIDMCGNCTSMADQCRQDCRGTWGGREVYDDCGVCGGDDSMCGLVRDCFGEWGGGQVIDGCGICGGMNRSCADACGMPYGDNQTCTGCDGNPNSGLVFDGCGICAGDNSSCAGWPHEAHAETILVDYGLLDIANKLIKAVHKWCKAPLEKKGSSKMP